MKVKEVAEKLGVHINTIYFYIETGQIKAEKVGRSWEISIEEFHKLLDRQRRTPKMAIESMNMVIDILESNKKMYEDLALLTLQAGNKDKSRSEAEKRLNSIIEDRLKIMDYDSAIELLKKERDDWYHRINTGRMQMNDVIDFRLSDPRAIEYRNSGDYFDEDES